MKNITSPHSFAYSKLDQSIHSDESTPSDKQTQDQEKEIEEVNLWLEDYLTKNE